MPRQYYSDKYIKHRRGAEKAEDNMIRSKALAQQALSDEREAGRQFKYEMEQEAQQQEEKEPSP